MSLIFVGHEGRRVKICDGVVAIFETFRQSGRSMTEAGGVLSGRIMKATDDLVIDDASSPTSLDARTRNRFSRHACCHQRFLDDAWASSQGARGYLGEWHTHPEKIPSPSHTDTIEWSRRLREAHFDGASLIFVIVGLEEVRVWECIDKGPRGFALLKRV